MDFCIAQPSQAQNTFTQTAWCHGHDSHGTTSTTEGFISQWTRVFIDQYNSSLEGAIFWRFQNYHIFSCQSWYPHGCQSTCVNRNRNRNRNADVGQLAETKKGPVALTGFPLYNDTFSSHLEYFHCQKWHQLDPTISSPTVPALITQFPEEYHTYCFIICP